MDAILAGLGAALATGIVSYLIARRKNSGSISTSDAASLWEESNNLRAEYKAQAEANRERAEKLEKQLEKVNSQLQAVLSELTNLKGHNATMMKKVNELKRIINKLRNENR